MNILSKIMGTIPFYYFYYQLNSELKKIQIKKLALNSTSLFHASSTVLLGINYFYQNLNSYLIQMNTGGYLIFDLIYMLKESNFDLLRLMYIYHHLACYPYMLLSAKQHYWPEVIFFAELSNIPNYFVYYSLKSDKAKNLGKEYKSSTTKILLNLQLYFYAFFRIFILGYYGLKELKNKNVPIPIYMTSVLYLFGLIWFSFMFFNK